MQRLWINIVKMLGWKFVLPTDEQRQSLQQCVFVVAPHTSVWDYIFGVAYLWLLDVNGKVFIKKEFFKPPIGAILRKYGAISIDRGNRNNNMVQAAVEMFDKQTPLAIAITPEATRKPVRRWKKGFWEISKAAAVPIVPAYIDYKNKRIGIGEPMMPTDSFEADVQRLKRNFRSTMARHPKQYIED